MQIPNLKAFLLSKNWTCIPEGFYISPNEKVIIKDEVLQLRYIDESTPDGPLKYHSKFDNYRYARPAPLLIMIHYLGLITDIQQYNHAINLIEYIETKGDKIYYHESSYAPYHGMDIFRDTDNQHITCTGCSIYQYASPEQSNESTMYGFSEFPLKEMLIELFCIINPGYIWNEIKDQFEEI